MIEIFATIASHLIVGFVWGTMIVGLGYAGYVTHRRRMARVRQYEARQRYAEWQAHCEYLARKALRERTGR